MSKREAMNMKLRALAATSRRRAGQPPPSRSPLSEPVNKPFPKWAALIGGLFMLMAAWFAKMDLPAFLISPLAVCGVSIPLHFGGLGDVSSTASNRTGTVITASGTAHVKGSYSTLISTTSRRSCGVWIFMKGPGTSATNTSMLLDLAFGDSGGGNEQIIVPNIMVGAASGANGTGRQNYFPCWIPSGKSVRARCQAVIVSDTVNVWVWLDQDPEFFRDFDKWVTYGADTATSNGTSVTPASGSFGTWTQIGGNSDPTSTHRIWTVDYAIGTDTTVAAADIIIEIGTGPDSSNVTTFGSFYYGQGSAEEIWGPFPLLVYRKIKTATKLWCRIASGEAEARRIVIHGGG